MAWRCVAAALALVVISCSGGGTESPDPSALFTEWASLARSAEQQDTIVVEGREGWLFFGPELRHLAVGKFWGEALYSIFTPSSSRPASSW
jgi:alginate O-acetyltransferase complex protein AlgJ